MTQATAQQVETVIATEIPDWVFDLLEDETEDRRFWITKGLGAGGTYGLAIWHLAMCEINRNSPISWSIAPTFQQVHDTLLPTFSEVAQTIFGMMEGIDFELLHSARPTFRFLKRKQEVHFHSARRADRMTSVSVSHISMTEPGLTERKAYERSSERLRCPKAARRQYFVEGCPEGVEGFYAEEADFPEGVDEEKNAVRVVLWTEDNHRLPKSYIAGLNKRLAHDENKRLSYTRGLFRIFTKGTAYWEFRESRNVVLNVHKSPFLPIIFSWDFGVNPLAWVALQQQPHERKGTRYHRFVALGEGDGEARGVQDACAQFIAQFPPDKFRNTPIEIDGGHDGYFGSHLSPSSAYDQILQYLRPYYTNIRVVASKAAPLVRDSLDRVAQLCVYERYVVAAWCRNLIKSHTESTLKKGTWEFEKKKEKDFTHFGDAARAPLFRMTREDDFERPLTKKSYGTNRPL